MILMRSPDTLYFNQPSRLHSPPTLKMVENNLFIINEQPTEITEHQTQILQALIVNRTERLSYGMFVVNGYIHTGRRVAAAKAFRSSMQRLRQSVGVGAASHIIKYAERGPGSTTYQLDPELLVIDAR